MALYRLRDGIEPFVEEVEQIDEDDVQVKDLKHTKCGGSTGRDTLPAGIPEGRYWVTKYGDIWSRTAAKNAHGEKIVLTKLDGHTDANKYNTVHCNISNGANRWRRRGR